MLQMTTNEDVAGMEKKGLGMKAYKLIVDLFLFIIIVFAIVPILWSLFISLKTQSDIFLKPFEFPDPIQWVNYKNALEKVPYLSMLKNTLLEMLYAIPPALFLYFINAFGIAKIPCGKANGILHSMYLAGIIVPGFVGMFPIYMIMNKLGLYDTIFSLSITHIVGSSCLATLLLTTMMKSIPTSLEEAAVIDGCGLGRVMFKLYLPLVKPTMITLFILMFLGIFNDFAMARVLLLSPENQTIGLAATYFKGRFTTDYAMMAAGMMILTVPQLAVFLSLQNQIIDGIMAGAVKG